MNDTIGTVVNQTASEVSSIVQQVLGEGATPVGELTATPIGSSAGHATQGIFRVVGHATTNRGAEAWSAVVKVLGNNETPSPGKDYDARKEVDVYRSAAFAEVCGGVRAPKCFAIQQRNELELLWLEDLSQAPQPPWDAELYIVTARHLGQFNGWWPEDALPSWKWLSQDGFRSEFAANPTFRERFQRLPSIKDHPIMYRYAPGEAIQELLTFWDECDFLLRQAEGTARGICHRDCHPRNLFPVQGADTKPHTVAIDWTKVGIANLGVDIGHMIDSSLLWGDIAPVRADELREPVVEAYLAGLSDVGWSGSGDGVRLTFLTRIACTALRATNLMVASIDNPKWYAAMEGFVGEPMEEINVRYGALREMCIQWKEEALQLVADGRQFIL